ADEAPDQQDERQLDGQQGDAEGEFHTPLASAKDGSVSWTTAPSPAVSTSRSCADIGGPPSRGRGSGPGVIEEGGRVEGGVRVRQYTSLPWWYLTGRPCRGQPQGDRRGNVRGSPR